MDENKTTLYGRGLVREIRHMIRLLRPWRISRIRWLWRSYRCLQRAARRRKQLYDNEGLVVPPVVMWSATARCNLDCTGCYSKGYPMENELQDAEVVRMLREAEALGSVLFLVTGGEPLLRNNLPEIMKLFPGITFLLFSNGTLIDDNMAERLSRMSNVIPILSVEGDREATDKRRGTGTHERIMAVFARLKRRHGLFGFSVTVSSENLREVGDAPFWQTMINTGCRIGFFMNFTPAGQDAPWDLVPEVGERQWFREQVQQLRERLPLVTVHMPDDEYARDGRCLAAGRGFVHINPQGFVEPCPFAHVAAANVRDSGLRAALETPFFEYIRGSDYVNNPPEIGCALLENMEQLLEDGRPLGAKQVHG